MVRISQHLNAGLLIGLLVPFFFSMLQSQEYYNHNQNLYDNIQYLKTKGIIPEIDLTTLPLNINELPDSLMPYSYHGNIKKKKPITKLGLAFKLSKSLVNKNLLSNNIDVMGDGIYTYFMFKDKHLLISNTMFVTNNKKEADRDKPYPVKNIYSYTNTAFIQGHWKIGNVVTTFLAGREYYKIGHARKATLFLNDFSRPYDQFRSTFKYKGVTMDLLTIQLNNIADERRLLHIHRLGLNLKNKLYISFNEGAFNTGVNRPIEFQYLNPFIYWLPDKTSSTTSRDSNSLLHCSISYYPTNGWNIWGEILVDDYQINHDKIDDLEPNELGFVLGFQRVDFPFETSDFWLEYSAVTNRTYQTEKLTETYIHKGYPIGHYLGNDFDMMQLYYSQENINKKVKPYISVSYIRDGANGLDTPFDTPWLDSTVTMGTGYSEPFPTSPITYVTEIELAADYHFRNGSFINAGLFYQHKTLQKKTEENFSFILRLWFTLDRVFNY